MPLLNFLLCISDNIYFNNDLIMFSGLPLLNFFSKQSNVKFNIVAETLANLDWLNLDPDQEREFKSMLDARLNTGDYYELKVYARIDWLTINIRKVYLIDQSEIALLKYNRNLSFISLMLNFQEFYNNTNLDLRWGQKVSRVTFEFVPVSIYDKIKVQVDKASPGIVIFRWS